WSDAAWRLAPGPPRRASRPGRPWSLSVALSPSTGEPVGTPFASRSRPDPTLDLRASMTLRELMGNGAPEVTVSGLAYSSRGVSDGTLFFCVPGFKADGHDFAADAVQRGAVALVCERP